MNHKFSFELTDELYLEASKLNYRFVVTNSKVFKMGISIILLYLVLSIPSAYVFEFSDELQNLLHISIIAASIWLFIIFFFAAISYLLLPSRSRKLLKQQQLLQGVHNYEVRDDALVLTTDLSNTSMPYKMAFKWAENAKVFAIYHSDQTFQILSKDAMSLEALDIIRAKLIAAGRPGKAL